MNEPVPDPGLLTLARAYLLGFDPLTRERGEADFNNGLVLNLASTGEAGIYAAEVRGTFDFHVEFTYRDGRCEAVCNCARQSRCRHTYAAVREHVARLEGDSKREKQEPDLGPEPVLLRDHLVRRLGRPLSRQEERYVAAVLDMFNVFRRTGQLTRYSFFSFMPELVKGSWQPEEYWPEPPQTELEFWSGLALLLRAQEIPIPGFLASITDFEKFEGALKLRRHRAEVRRWREALGRLALESHVVNLPEIDLRLVVGADLQLEVKRSYDSGFRLAKPAELRRLMSELEHGTARTVPEALPISSWLRTMRGRGWNPGMTFEQEGLDLELSDLFRVPSLQDRLVGENRMPFQHAADELRWSLQLPATGGGNYRLRLTLPSGDPAPRIHHVLPGHPTLYLSDGIVYKGPPFPEILEKAASAEIPAPALETREGIAFLLKLGVDLPPVLAARTRRVELAVGIRCELKSTSRAVETEAVFLRIETEKEPEGGKQVFTESGWVARGSVRPSNDIFYVYDRSQLALFPAVLDGLSPSWDYGARSWRVRLTRNFAEKCVAWLQSVPKSIHVELDPTLATLLKDPVKAEVQLQCEPADVDWFDLKVGLNVGDTELTPEEIKALLDARGRFVRLGSKGWRRLEFNLTNEEDEQLARLGLSSKDFSSEPQRLHALQLADKAAARMLPEAQAEKIRRRAAELKTQVTPPIPDTVRAELRPYQVDGFHFLAYLSTNRFGGILADDMGLGKTVQALTWIAWLRTQSDGGAKPNLVVCPKSVTDNWRAEAERFVPGLRVLVWRGGNPVELPERLKETDILVINYAQLRILSDGLSAASWNAVILDEGQYIKNPESQTAKVARSLKAAHRLVLTGTPIENRLLDLWSLMAFAMPGVLGNRTYFNKQFDQPGDRFARQRLAARVRPFLLRRTKSQVASELPDRTEEDLLCEMEKEQKLLYRAEFKRAQRLLLNIKTPEELNDLRFHFLTSLLRLRQICCHPGLYNPDAKTAESAKVNALGELLEPLMAEGHKVLVFSQFVSMLDILKADMRRRGWPCFYLAGETENRGEVVTKFQENPGAAVFLISLKAGGFGLNLTAASYVVLFDPWWNPAVENQAIDRTHRIGQTNKVIAYRLLIKDSIEDKIRALQRSKAALAQDILGEEKFAGSLTLEDLKFLFGEGEGSA